MRSRQGLPPAPAPQIRQGVNNHGTQQNHANWPTQGALTAQAVTAALANPYSQTYTSAGYSSGYTSSHYAQAYMQSNWPATNPEGYTISSTYVPRSSSAMPQRTDIPTKNGAHSRPTQQLPSQGQGSWYQFGHSRCTYKDCIFTGSQKSVEIHMMDRHLIYPPGWDSRKKQSDWDTDPSLKGKPIHIQGTTINLDDPEVLEVWLTERKKWWPSVYRVEEKKRKLDEAITRGQISVDDPAFLRGKRLRLNSEHGSDWRSGRGGGVRNRGRGRGRGRGADGGWRGRGKGGPFVQPRNDGPSATSQVVTSDPDTSLDSDDNAPPEIVTSRRPPSLVHHESSSKHVPEDVAPKSEGTILVEPESSQTPLQPAKKPRLPQPKKTPHNPFASRPTLLRNLLLPEIRITISNLSQAIRFLVDNDFLKDVEMKPGEADEKLIEVVSDGVASPDQKQTQQ